MKINNYTQYSSHNKNKEIREIFLETTNLDFTYSREEDFFYKWCGQYIENSPDYFFIATINDKIVGYICGDTTPSQNQIIDAFSKHYIDYPAHLHINLRLEYQNKGYGSLLIGHLLSIFDAQKAPGTHIITENDNLNNRFYLRHNFKKIDFTIIDNKNLVFMGRPVSFKNH